jgi:hypothetical protein
VLGQLFGDPLQEVGALGAEGLVGNRGGGRVPAGCVSFGGLLGGCHGDLLITPVAKTIKRNLLLNQRYKEGKAMVR